MYVSMIGFEFIHDEIDLLMKFTVSLILLIMMTCYNYIRTLDRETLITDVTVVRAIVQGKYTYLKEDGKIVICMKNPCNNCDTCPSFNHGEKE